MDKVVIVFSDFLEDYQDAVLLRYIRWLTRRPTSKVRVPMNPEAKKTYEMISREDPVLVVFVVEPYEHLMVTEQCVRFETNPKFNEVQVVILYLDQLDFAGRKKPIEGEEVRKAFPRKDPPEIPAKFRRQVDEIFEEMCERNIPTERAN